MLSYTIKNDCSIKYMTGYSYQKAFSKLRPESTYDTETRRKKANKMLAVLDDFYAGDLQKLTALDIGCSTGIITNILKDRFNRVVGIDIDEDAIKYARETHRRDNLQFCIQDSMNLGFPENSFDVVICAHVYEHVPDYMRLMREIHRVLNPGGVCYFAAGNRLSLMETHYKLPLLSVVPKFIGHMYLRLLGKGDYYYENHLTLRGLHNIASIFKLIDYTGKIIADPAKYRADEMLKAGSFKQRIAAFICKRAYMFCPTYIWLLVKERK